MRTLALVLLSCVWLLGCGRADLQKPDQRPAQPPPAVEPETGPETGRQIGDLAPEIEGVDLEGVPLRLSDYRGKVVVLDFWGDW